MREQILLAQNADEERHVDQQAYQRSGERAVGEKNDPSTLQDQQYHYAELQSGTEKILAEENRARAAEDGEQRDEQLIQCVQRHQIDHDEEQRQRLLITASQVRELGGKEIQGNNERDTGDGDGAGHQQQSAKKLVVLFALVVNRGEPRYSPVQAKRGEGTQKRDCGKRICPGPVVRSGKVADHQDLRREFGP